jgi:hypothetical protein
MSEKRQRHTTDADTGSPPHVELAAEALLAGITREQVIARLVSRIRRDEGYLADRKACNRHTRYDDEVTADLHALALAAVLLGEEGHRSNVERVAQRVGERSGRSRWRRR